MDTGMGAPGAGARGEAEEALRLSEERLRVAIEAADLATWEWDITNNALIWSDRLLRLFGMEPREQGPQVLTLHDWIGHVHPEDRESVSSVLGGALEYSDTFETEFRILRAGTGEVREVRWVKSYGRAVATEGGRTSRVMGVLIDTTARHEAQQALESSRAQMERLVRERTGELARVNAALEGEVAERRRAEAGREMLLRRLVSTQEEERRRLARELHDQMGQTLTALMMGLKSLPSIPDPGLGAPSPDGILARLQAMTTDLMDDVQHLAWELRPALPDSPGLRPALEEYVRTWSQRSGVRADFLAHGASSTRLPSDIESALFRVVQEALTNVARHAQATHASVLLEHVAREVVVIIEDDGRGFGVESQATSRRLGMVGMRERVDMVGGALTIESSTATGTSVYVRVPLGGE